MATRSSMLAGKFHGQRNLVGYVHGIAESDTTERLSVQGTHLPNIAMSPQAPL